MLQLRIEPIRTLTNESSEAGQLVWLGGRLAALIVEAEGGWYLHTGLGPFEGEGLIFPSVLEIEDWVRANLLAFGLGR